jgi:Fe(3+) dicitrate transport protein
MPVKNRSTDKLTANKATNNARQIFAQVVGLTINESSDGGLQLSIGGRGLDQIERLT